MLGALSLIALRSGLELLHEIEDTLLPCEAQIACVFDLLTLEVYSIAQLGHR